MMKAISTITALAVGLSTISFPHKASAELVFHWSESLQDVSNKYKQVIGNEKNQEEIEKIARNGAEAFQKEKYAANGTYDFNNSSEKINIYFFSKHNDDGVAQYIPAINTLIISEGELDYVEENKIGLQLDFVHELSHAYDDVKKTVPKYLSYDSYYFAKWFYNFYNLKKSNDPNYKGWKAEINWQNESFSAEIAKALWEDFAEVEVDEPVEAKIELRESEVRAYNNEYNFAKENENEFTQPELLEQSLNYSKSKAKQYENEINALKNPQQDQHPYLFNPYYFYWPYYF